MAGSSYGAVVQQIDRLFRRGNEATLPEWQLLHRYLSARDESAFEAIVARHGPMVLGVCRRVLRDPDAVEDAFQATFLVLVRKARTLGERDAIGHWLYGVAHRVALRARGDSARRQVREQTGTPCTALAAMENSEGAELASILDEELSRLPAKYRAPIVLCYLEGLTHEAAASQLGWPVGTVKGRLARARDLLRGRLARRGLAPGAAVVAAALSAHTPAAAAEPLILATVRAASQTTAGRLTGSLVSAAAARLTEGVLSTMFVSKVKLSAVVGVSLGGLVLGAWALAQQGGGQPRDGAPQSANRPAASGKESHPNDAKLGGLDLSRSALALAEDDGADRLKEQALIGALEKPIALQFKGATLRNALKQIKANTHERSLPTPAGIPIYVDPAGLEEAGATINSPVSWPTKDAPLRVALDEMLRPLKLAATTRDGLLVVSSRQEIALIEIRKLADQLRSTRKDTGDGSSKDAAELSAAEWLTRLPGPGTVYHSEAPPSEAIPEVDAKTKAILEALKKPVPMSFRNETPLEDVLKYIRERTKGKELPDGLPIYVDPVGLQEAEKTLVSPVQLDLTGVPLRETLRLVLKQLGLVYAVGNGMLTITSPKSEDSTTPILALAQKAELGQLSSNDMKHLVELFRLRAEIQRYASGAVPETTEPAKPKGAAQPSQPAAKVNVPPREVEDEDATTKAIRAALEKVVTLHFNDQPAEAAIKEIEKMTVGPDLPEGVPIYMSPGQKAQMTVSIDLKRVKLKTGLRLLLGQVDLAYTVKEGLVIIAPPGSPELFSEGGIGAMGPGMMGGPGGGMGGMGGGFR